jgi:hypothetical protein
MPRQDRSSDQDATEQLNDSPGKDELAITPAGPVRRENVHPVSPNDVVRRELDGSYMITPRTDSKGAHTFLHCIFGHSKPSPAFFA